MSEAHDYAKRADEFDSAIKSLSNALTVGPMELIMHRHRAAANICIDNAPAILSALRLAAKAKEAEAAAERSRRIARAEDRTPGPWHVPRERTILGPNGEYIGELDIPADAAFIVRAVNAHDALVAALLEAERFLDYFASYGRVFVGPGTPESALATVRAALALAEGKAR
jgi:hypothetical protein